MKQYEDAIKLNKAIAERYDFLGGRQRKELRERYIQAQQGFCPWCKERLDANPPEDIAEIEIDWGLFPKKFLNAPIHLQHNHNTGMTEAAVHAKCNAVMWQYYRI